jgi:magnesium chelatase family protein
MRYLKRLSGPILDRMDLHVEMSPLTSRELLESPSGESSASIRDRVIAARQRQADRGQEVPNGSLDAAGIQRWAPLDVDTRDLMSLAGEEHRLSSRATTRAIKVARTIADLEGADQITSRHAAIALAFRPPLGLG